jgi:hypothetical protein
MMLLGCGGTLAGWTQGSVPWWLALAALWAAVKTAGAVRQVRSYKAWESDWKAMSGESEPLPQRPKRSIGEWLLIGTAGLLLVAIPHSPALQGHGELAVLWCVAGLYLVWKLLRLSRLFPTRRSLRSAAPERRKAEAAPVAWLVPCAASSPSRLEAERELPEYAARLIGSGN